LPRRRLAVIWLRFALPGFWRARRVGAHLAEGLAGVAVGLAFFPEAWRCKRSVCADNRQSLAKTFKGAVPDIKDKCGGGAQCGSVIAAAVFDGEVGGLSSCRHCLRLTRTILLREHPSTTRSFR